MAVSVSERFDAVDMVRKSSQRLSRRHYKKDSRFVLDLYTLTYDYDENLDSLGDLTERRIETNIKEDLTTCEKVIKTRNDNQINLYRSAINPSNSLNGMNFQLYFMGQHVLKMNREQYYDETLALPIHQTKSLLSTINLSSSAGEKSECLFNALTSLPSKPLNHTQEIPNTNGEKEDVYANNLDGMNNQKEKSNFTTNSVQWLQEFRNNAWMSLRKICTCTTKHRNTNSVSHSIKTHLKKVQNYSGFPLGCCYRLDTGHTSTDKSRSTRIRVVECLSE